MKASFDREPTKKKRDPYDQQPRDADSSPSEGVPTRQRKARTVEERRSGRDPVPDGQTNQTP